jgi:hypothetical protein
LRLGNLSLRLRNLSLRLRNLSSILRNVSFQGKLKLAPAHGGVDEEHAKEQEKLRERGTGAVVRCPYPTLSAYRYLQSVLCAAVPAIIHVSYTMRTGQFCTLHAVLVWHHHRSTHKAIHKVLGGGADTSVGRSAWV